MLIIPIWVNNHEVGRAELVRIDPLDSPTDAGVECTYTIRYYGGKPYPVFEGLIKHPYVPNDPLPLTIAALSKIEVMKSENRNH